MADTAFVQRPEHLSREPSMPQRVRRRREAAVDVGADLQHRGGAQVAILVVLALVWEVYARWLNNPLLFPTFTATIEAFCRRHLSGGLLRQGAGPRSRCC